MNIEQRIKNQIHYSFDGARKDSKKRARKEGIKYFQKLTIKYANKDFLHLKCLRNSKPCCKTLVLRLERNNRFCDYYPFTRNHIKCQKLEVGAKAIIDMRTKFWARMIPKSTFMDYLSNDIGNLVKTFSDHHVNKYRNVKHYSFPVVNHVFDHYVVMFTQLQQLRSLKMISINIQSSIQQQNVGYYCLALQQLWTLKAIFINCRLTTAENIENLLETFEKLINLRHISMQLAKITAKPIREKYMESINKLLQKRKNLTHLSLDLFLHPTLNQNFIDFFNAINEMKDLVSLNIKADMPKGEIKVSEQEIQQVNSSPNNVIKNLKYSFLECNNQQVSTLIQDLMIQNTSKLVNCNIKNIPFINSNYIQTFSQNKDTLQELQLAFDDIKYESYIPQLLSIGKYFKKLSYLSLQYLVSDEYFLQAEEFDEEGEEELELSASKTGRARQKKKGANNPKPKGVSIDFKEYVANLDSLKSLDTLVLEVICPIKTDKKMIERLFQKIAKMKTLISMKIDLNFLERVSFNKNLLTIFENLSLEIISMSLENVTAKKDDEPKIKEKCKLLPKLTTCLIECDSFRIDKTF